MIPSRITVHTTASPFLKNIGASDIDKDHRARGWRCIGYHKVIRLDGSIEDGRPLNQQGAGVAGENKNNIHIALVGGLDANGEPSNTYTHDQKSALFGLIYDLCDEFKIPYEKVLGHRDYSPDRNGDGVITSDEFIKECPCFDVQHWLNRQLDKYGIL